MLRNAASWVLCWGRWEMNRYDPALKDCRVQYNNKPKATAQVQGIQWCVPPEKGTGWVWWYMSVIPAAWEAEEDHKFESSPGKD
jgi:hypothetical protein